MLVQFAVIFVMLDLNFLETSTPHVSVADITKLVGLQTYQSVSVSKLSIIYAFFVL